MFSPFFEILSNCAVGCRSVFPVGKKDPAGSIEDYKPHEDHADGSQFHRGIQAVGKDGILRIIIPRHGHQCSAEIAAPGKKRVCPYKRQEQGQQGTAKACDQWDHLVSDQHGEHQLQQEKHAVAGQL